MITNFNEQILRLTSDANLAVFIENIASWIRFNASKAVPAQRNYHDGRYWTYSSYPELVKYFGNLWSVQTIRTMVNKCVKHGLLVTGNFNKKKYDNTNWYTLSDLALQHYPVLLGMILDTPVESNRPPVEINRPIPSLPYQSSINTTNSESNDSPAAAPLVKKPKSSIDFRELIDIYEKWFPDNPQPHKKGLSTLLEKTIRTLVKKWPEAHPHGLPFTTEQFDKYLERLSYDAPKFSKGEYITAHGNKKKNNMVTFCRWDTFIQFLEGKYS